MLARVASAAEKRKDNLLSIPTGGRRIKGNIGEPKR